MDGQKSWKEKLDRKIEFSEMVRDNGIKNVWKIKIRKIEFSETIKRFSF